MVGRHSHTMTRFYPEFDMSPPDEYYANEWERRCRELDEEAEENLLGLMQAADKVGSDWARARPEVTGIIRLLFDLLDPSNTTEAALMYEIEKADRICRVQNQAAKRMIEYESDHYRDTPYGTHFSGA